MSRPAWLLLAAAFCTLGVSAAPVRAGEVQVAVAANFTAPMKIIATQFAQQSGHKVLASYGATGKFYAQIRHGAPFDVLLAADAEVPARLEQEQATVPGSRFTYAIGKLVLWSAQPGLVDAQGAVLKTGKFDHLAMADPKLAPYGQAALDTLEQLGLATTLKPKFVTGESIGQAYQFIASGAAPLGFVAMAQVFENDKLKAGSAWVVPPALHRPIRQDAVVLTGGAGKPAVAAFIAYLKSEPARAVMRAYGYTL